MATIDAKGLRVGAQPLENLLVLGPGDVAGVRVVQEDQPLIPRHGVALDAAVGLLFPAAPPKRIRAGVARVFQDVEHAPEIDRLPDGLALAGATGQVPRELQMLRVEVLDDGVGRAGTQECLEQQSDTGLDLLIGIETDAALGVVDEAHRQPNAELPGAGLVHDAAA